MERTRPNRAQQAEPEDIAAVEPLGGPALWELMETLRGPTVMKADVDALQAALARPLQEDETPRQRADVLLALMEDAQVRDYKGNGGRTVRAAAVEALVGLGYPYALEVPPEAMAERPGASPAEEGEYRVPWGALTVGLLNVVVQAIPVLTLLYIFENWDHGHGRLGLATVGAGLLLTPPLLAALGGAWRLPWLQSIGIALMVVGCIAWGGASLVALSSGLAGLLMLIPATLQVVSTWQLSQSWVVPPKS